MLAIIDADSYAYAAAIMSAEEGEQAARTTLNLMIENTLLEVGTQDFACFITGEGNFRYGIFPEYKAQRRNVEKPAYLQMLKDHLRDAWGATVSKGCEADDLVGIEAMRDQDREVIIVSIDKDLNTIPGWHYNPKKKERYLLSPRDAIRFFYWQLLVGDSADGVKGAKGIGPKKAEKILDNAFNNWMEESGKEEELAWHYYSACEPFYSCEEELLMNAQVLYIWQKENDSFKIPTLDVIS